MAIRLLPVFFYLFGLGQGHKKVCKTDNLDYINYSNIVKLTDCTKIIGNIKIVEATFAGDPYLNIPALHPYQLGVFKTVTELTGVLIVQGAHEDFKDLSFLGNLTTIYGRNANKFGQGAALSVAFTSVESLDLSSLRTIRNGNVVIVYNDNLCYVDSIKFGNLFLRKTQKATVAMNRPTVECALSGRKCATVCGNGCWGPERDNCVGNITETNLVEDPMQDLYDD